jgi:hypothetical protein
MYECRTGPVVAVEAILNAVSELEANGSIDDRGLAGSLRASLGRARAALTEGDTDAAVRELARLIDHIERHTPHHITEAAARALVEQIVREDWRHGDEAIFYMYV